MLKSPKQWMISGSLISICYVPWLVVLYHQTAERVGNYWIKPVTMKEIPEYFKFLFASDIPYSEWMIVFLFGLGIYQSIKDIMENKESGAVALYYTKYPNSHSHYWSCSICFGYTIFYSKIFNTLCGIISTIFSHKFW